MRKHLPILLVIFITSCGPKIYTSDNFSSALARHKTVAIIPAEVNMRLRPNEAKSLSDEQVDEIVTQTSYDIQDKMYGWFLRRSNSSRYTVTFQDINKTNSKLKAAGIKYADLRNKDRAELAKILEVDAVIQDRVSLEKPMSEGVAIATRVIFGTWESTNRVQTTINIHDGKSGNLLWKYDYEASGSVGSSSTRLVDNLLKKAAKRFPYRAS